MVLNSPQKYYILYLAQAVPLVLIRGWKDVFIESSIMRHYALKGFLRAVPNDMLAEYFKRDGLLSDIDFNEIRPTNIAPLFDAIQQLPDKARANIDTDFQDIFALSYDTGVKLLLDESRYCNIDFLENFDSLKGNYAKSFWAFLNHKSVFESTLPFSCRDNMSGTWRKRGGFPISTGVDFSSKKEQFAMANSRYHQPGV
ncbi:MAG: hypothetical protein AABY33_08165 [Pseudomonadota bacterium]